MEIKNVLIMGAGHGIGASLVKASLEKFENSKVFASYKNPAQASDLLNISNQNLITINTDPNKESELVKLKEKIEEHTDSLDLVILCMGVLDSDYSKAEKRIDDIEYDGMAYTFATNAISHALSVKHLKPLIRKKNTTSLIHLSAKVGSISDNEIGGWYSYRMSKASLNMLVKNLDIEFKRSSFNCNVIALHPGTTHTKLSENYLKSVKYQIFSMTKQQHIY